MTAAVRILLVDDEPDFLESIAFLLTSKGYAVEKAQNGDEALGRVRQQPPDVIFMDVNMPGISGIETLRQLRAFNKTVPVILVTAALADENQFAGAHALGISGLFPKSGDMSALLQVLQVALRRLRPSEPPAPAAPPRSGGWLRNLLTKLRPSR
jgi:CheY-like chemotaxis protein